MRKLLLLLPAFFILNTLAIQAQNRTITGIIKTPDQQPLENATIVVVGQNKRSFSQADGSFSILLHAPAGRLKITAVGYNTQEITINNTSDYYTVVLEGAPEALEEVVVTPYGNTNKKTFTGTSSVITNKQMRHLQLSSVAGVLQGNASGVWSIGADGQPGNSPAIRVRGIGSANASSNPLIIVDGAPYGGAVNAINPADVENITILKDASSTSLYGSRAANGVLVITTKSSAGKSSINFSATTGISQRAVPEYELLNVQQLYELTWEALRNDARIQPSLISASGASSAEGYATEQVASWLVYNPFNKSKPIGLDGKLVSDAQLLWNDDWFDALLRDGHRKEYNLHFAGSSKSTRYTVSGGYLNDEGLVAASNFKRYTGRFKLESQVNNWLALGLNTNLAYATQNYGDQIGAAQENVYRFIRKVAPIYPIYLRDPATGNKVLDNNGKQIFDYGDNGSLTRPSSMLRSANPASVAFVNTHDIERFISSANAYIEAAFTPDLQYKSQYAVDYYNLGEDLYANPEFGNGASYGGGSNKKRTTTVSQTFTNTLTYKKEIFPRNRIHVVAGMEAFKFTDAMLEAEKRGFTIPNVEELDYAATPYIASSVKNENRMEGYFARLNYELQDKYFLSLSIRRDGSSRFASDVRWGTFYSIGTAWNILGEKFLANTAMLSTLKLRASYGTSGNQGLIGYFPYLATYASGSNVLDENGAIIDQLGNDKLSWESQHQLDIGMDIGFLQNRITAGITYFNRVSNNLLFYKQLANSTGVAGVYDNAGKFKNAGIEFDLQTINIEKKHFNWTTSFNLSYIKNEVLELPNRITGKEVGRSWYTFYLPEFAGVAVSDGRPMWYKNVRNAAGEVTGRTTTKVYADANSYYAGSSVPDFTGGITNMLQYKSWDCNILAAFSVGAYVYDADYADLMHGGVVTFLGANASVDMLERWQGAHNTGNGKVPLLTTRELFTNSNSTRYLFKGDYLRIRNITIGYTMPATIVSKAKLQSLRVYGSIQNPFTFFKGPKGLDPEQGISGISNYRSAAYKTISAGIQLQL